MNKKTLTWIIIIIVIILLGWWYMRSKSATQTASADTSFENDAAAIMSAKVDDATKIANLKANLDARMAARASRNAKNGSTSRVIPGVTTK